MRFFDIRRFETRCEIQEGCSNETPDNVKKAEEEWIGGGERREGGGLDLRSRGAAVNKSRDKFRKSPN